MISAPSRRQKLHSIGRRNTVEERQSAVEKGKEMRWFVVCMSWNVCFTTLLFPYMLLTVCCVVVGGWEGDHLTLHYLFQVVYLNSLLHPLLYIALADDGKMFIKRWRRLLDREKRELDRKSANHLLMRQRFSGSI